MRRADAFFFTIQKLLLVRPLSVRLYAPEFPLTALCQIRETTSRHCLLPLQRNSAAPMLAAPLRFFFLAAHRQSLNGLKPTAFDPNADTAEVDASVWPL